jgi:hypothetical protein
MNNLNKKDISLTYNFNNRVYSNEKTDNQKYIKTISFLTKKNYYIEYDFLIKKFKTKNIFATNEINFVVIDKTLFINKEYSTFKKTISVEHNKNFQKIDYYEIDFRNSLNIKEFINFLNDIERIHSNLIFL